MEQTINDLHNRKICPFYFYLDMITNSPDIILCNMKDILDLKSKIQLNQLADFSEYTLLIDECNTLEKNFTSFYSMNIDDELLSNASLQLFNLRDKHLNESKIDSKKNCVISKGDTENEFLFYNRLANLMGK